MRIKPLVVLSLVCSLSQAADTVASLGDSIKATQFVTEVDHTKLVNGTTEVIANADGTASIATADSTYGNPVFTIHAGSVFTGDTAEHSKTFTEDCVVDFSGIDLSGSSPPIVQKDGWTFVAPTDDSAAKTLWCGPTDYPAWQFSLSNYDSGSPTATHVEDPEALFSGSLTVSRPRGVLIATVDNVLVGSTETANYSRKFTTSQAHEYVFVNTGNNNPIFSISPVDVSLFNGSIGIGSSSISSLGLLSGIGKFQKNGYSYVFPYTDNNGSGSYTLATTSMINGLASKTYVDSHQWTWASITNKPDVVTSIAIGRNNTGVSGDTELVLTHADPSVTLTTNYPTGIKIGSLSYTAGFAQLDIFEKDGPGFSPDWENQPLITDIYIPSNVSAFNNDAGYVPASTATNIAKQIIRDAVSGVNTDIQTAEDARVALTNLITILKNL